MKYFLAVSDLLQTIDFTAERILYIEDGCIKEKNADAALILDKSLKSSEEVQKAFEETDIVYEAVLESISKALNNFHHINFNKEVWRILLFEWLGYYIEAMYHKLINVNRALEYGEIYSNSMDQRSYQHPFFWRGFWMWALRKDSYNFQLYSNVLQFKGIEIKENISVNEPVKGIITKHRKKTKDRIRSMLRKTVNRLSCKAETLIVNPHNFGFTIKHLLMLVIRSRLKIGFFYPEEIEIRTTDYDKSIREKINVRSESNYDCELKKLVSAYVMQDMPIIFVEGFKEAWESVRNFQCKNIISAEDYSEDCRVSILMAATRNRKGKIYLIQIGGDADIPLGRSEALLDARIADVLYSGGWKNKKYPCIIGKLTNPRYWKAKKAVKNCYKKYDIMYVGTAVPAYRLVLGLGSSLWPREYLNDNIELIAHLVEDRDYKMKVRFLSFNEGWRMEERLRRRLKEGGREKRVALDDCTKRLIDTVQDCKLCIVSSIETVWAEMLVMGIPVLFFIPEYLEYYSEEGWKLVDKLKAAGIYFHSYQEIIQCLDNINDLGKWWQEKDAVIHEIRNQYCWCAENPPKEWMDEFVRVSKE